MNEKAPGSVEDGSPAGALPADAFAEIVQGAAASEANDTMGAAAMRSLKRGIGRLGMTAASLGGAFTGYGEMIGRNLKHEFWQLADRVAPEAMEARRSRAILAQDAAGGGQMTAAPRTGMTKVFDELWKDTSEFVKNQTADVPRPKLWDHPEQMLEPSWWAENLPEQAVYYVPAYVAGVMSGGSTAVAGLVAGTMEGGSDFRTLMEEKDVDPGDAFARAALSIAAIGALNAAGFEPVFNYKGSKNPIVKFFTRFMANGTTEYAEEPAQLTTTELGLVPVDEFSRKMVRTLKDAFDVIPIAGIMGGVGGAVTDIKEERAYQKSARIATSPEGLAVWAERYPDRAAMIAGMDVPSRAAFEVNELPRVSLSERVRIAKDLQEIIGDPAAGPTVKVTGKKSPPALAPAAPPPAPAPVDSTKPPAAPPEPIKQPETKPPAPDPLPPLVADDESELDNAQRALDDAEMDLQDAVDSGGIKSVRRAEQRRDEAQKRLDAIKAKVAPEPAAKTPEPPPAPPAKDPEPAAEPAAKTPEPTAPAATPEPTPPADESPIETTDPGISRRANPGSPGDRSFVARAFIKGTTISVMGVGSTEAEALAEMQIDAKRKKPAPEPTEKPDFVSQARAIITSDDDTAAKTRQMKALAKDHSLEEKVTQERVESVLVDVAREIATDKTKSPEQKFKDLTALYSKQPRFGARTSGSVARQAYSTPIPLSYAGAVMADISDENGLYEPTGGHGSLTITADKANVSINEIDPERVSSLQRQGYDDITTNDATTWTPKPKSVDRVATNPPFGKLDQEVLVDGYRIRKLEHLIAIRALSAMKDDGKGFVIIGASMMKGETGATDRIFLNYLMNHYNVAANFELNGDLYDRQGAGFPVRMIVIHGRKATPSPMADVAPSEVPRLDTWDQLWETVKEVVDENTAKRLGMEPGGRGSPGIRGDTAGGGKAAADDAGPGGYDSNNADQDGEGSGGAGEPGGLRGEPAGRPRNDSGLDQQEDADVVEPASSAAPDGSVGDAGGSGTPGGVAGSGGRGGPGAVTGVADDAGTPERVGSEEPGGLDAGKPDVANPDAALTDLSDADIEAMVNEVKSENAAPAPDPQPGPTAAGSPPPKVGRKGKTKSTPAAKPTGKRGGKAIASSAASNAGNALDQAAQGLYQLFGGGKNLGMGLAFDEDTYAKAKPYFEQAWASLKASGKDIKDFVRWAVGLNIPGNISAYITRFRDDLVAAKTKMDERRAAEKHEWTKANDRQDNYGGQSLSPKIGTLINHFLSNPTRDALKLLNDEVGDIDEWVRGKLGYASFYDLHTALSGEQVDGVALAISRIEKGGAMIIGDQTGIGKGRQAAAIIRYAKQRGWTPVFMTADPKLFSDMYSDLGDIGTKVSPLLLGDTKKATITNANDEVLVQAGSTGATGRQARDMNAVGIGGQTLEDLGYDSVFMTYSQAQNLGEGGQPSVQHRFLTELAGGGPVLLVMDESHKASGTTSNIGLFMRGGSIRKKINGVTMNLAFPGLMTSQNVKGVVYLSATYAKRPDSMPLYFRTTLGRAVRNAEALAEIFARGGVALQQAVAEALARAGEYIRRESDFAGVSFQSKSAADTPEKAAAAIDRIDTTTAVLREIVEFARAVKAAVERDPRNDIESTSNTDAGLSTGDFSSTIHNYISQLLLAAKADAAADEAIAAWKRGEKPIIALANTMGHFVDEYSKDNGIKEGDTIGLNFADILHRGLERTLRAVETDAGGNDTPIMLDVDQLGLRRHYDFVLGMIDELKTDLPASPIDHMMKRMRDAGMVVDEITGRKEYLEYRDDGDAVYHLRTVKEIKDKNAHVNKFNREITDALIINQAGATGISLHASKKNAKYNPKPRHMIIAQADLNIDTFTQVLGRILRTGMVGVPGDFARYTLLSLPIEAERRPNAVLSSKMKSLNANTTADTKGEVQVEALDFMNKYGDQVAAQILAEDPELQAFTDIEVAQDEEGVAEGEPDTARKLTGRMAIFENAKQAEVYTLLQQRYNSLIQEMKDAGTYDLEIDVQHGWKAQPVSSELLEAGTDQSSMFTADLRLNTYSIIDQRTVPTPDELRKTLKRLHGSDDLATASATMKQKLADTIQSLQAQFDKYVAEPVLPDGLTEEQREQRMAAWKTKRDNANVHKDRVLAKLSEISDMMGSKVRVAPGIKFGQLLRTYGFITDVRHVPSPGNPFRPSSFVVETMVESRLRKIHIPLSQLFRETHGAELDPTQHRNTGIEGFAQYAPRDERVNQRVLVGNLVRAQQLAEYGQITSFATEDGQIVTGLVPPLGWRMDDVEAKNDPRYSLNSGDAVIRFLQGGWKDRQVWGPDKSVTISYKRGTFIIRSPRANSRGAVIYLDPGVISIIGEMATSGRDFVVQTDDSSKIRRLADYIIRAKKMTLTGHGEDHKAVREANGLPAEPDSDTMGAPPRRPAAPPAAPAAPAAPATNTKDADLTQNADIISAIERMWPGLSVRGRGTSRRKGRGWYSRVLGEMRLRNERDFDAALHELGHHFDRELGMWSKSHGVPTGVPAELIRLGQSIYSQRPPGGYRAEGFAEFVRGYITGDNMQMLAPALHQWFTTDYLVSHPEEAKKIRKLEDLVLSRLAQTPEQAIRAFRQPLKKDWSASRLAASMAAMEAQHRDQNLPVLRAMLAAGFRGVDPSKDPYMLLTAYSRSAGGRTLHAALSQTIDLAGNVNGISLREALSPVADMGKDGLEDFWDYAVARRAQVYHAQNMESGIDPAVADQYVAAHETQVFKDTLDAVTDWSRRQLHLLVEAGMMTQAEFDKIVRMNPVYIPFSRQFLARENEKNKGIRGGGKPVYRKSGGGQEINAPLDALIMQAEKITSAAMQAHVVTALVRLYDEAKRTGSVDALGTLMSEEAAPLEATNFSAEHIKKEIASIALNLGADPNAVMASMGQVWNQRLTVFTKGTEYKGRENIVSVVVDGKRRFFNIDAALSDILVKNNQTRLLPGVLGEISRQAVGLQRLGATGLNPAFGVLRNPMRDTLTASATAQYHFHIPVFSTLAGMVKDIADVESARLYHSMGIDTSGRIGQDMRIAKRVGQRVVARTGYQRVKAMGWISGIREILSHSEVGPRLMEFEGARNYARSKGLSVADANILAACAAKDVTVNFSRAGSVGAKINEVTLFYNAAAQSIDKFMRATGMAAPAPWAKEQSRAKTALTTLGKGLLWMSVAALANYLRNRDDDWWKDLPPYEKWGFIHIKGWALNANGTPKRIARIPLPFELGAIFGSLPAAWIEDSRSPGTFKEALALIFKVNNPIDLDPTSLQSIAHSIGRNISAVAPLADIAANRDWKGDNILSPNVAKWRVPADQYGPNTSDLAKHLGRMSGYSPAYIDHALNGYTAGLYRRIVDTISTVQDSSGVTTDDPSTIPVLGTLFLRHGATRITSAFYDRLEVLAQRKGSNLATLSELGELAAGDKLSRSLESMWDERRAAYATGPRGSAKETADRIIDEVVAKIKEYNKMDFSHEGAKNLIYAATAPEGEKTGKALAKLRSDQALAEDMLSDMSPAERAQALRDAVRDHRGKIRARSKSGRLTAYGRRVGRMNDLEDDSE